ncbi:phosphotransferase [Cellulomonas sp. zg-ZUI222]|uniref:Phosphotransferase n=1 Tax=Cellulomonas wangleii TaxID=2816956 RepID=A0ABX8D7H7_9CELL|nr:MULTISPECIES: phosphotransferase [Cellulomonas]MBO0901066.1 phosphotransferase [Cellulomonas sp. zg-ZUI22]MBO0921725.1 phosphotransferase [Cellulomonas wangleii]MBO0925214.1 phosphotransferase [Cellulomonas wangleii]QVI63388.1 phosphotransferase [Cellulomonas wangleii]
MSADDVMALPLAFGGQRLDWRDLPRAVRERIETLAGARVTAEMSATSGFSPGFCAVLELTDGRAVFVKAVSADQNPHSPDLARAEIRAARALPPEVPAPALRWWDDDGHWVLLGFDAVHGRSPELPWRSDDLALVLRALDDLARCTPAPGHDLPRADDLLAEDFTGWRSMLRGTPQQREHVAELLEEPGRWALDHLDELVAWEQDALRVCAGDSLVHGDLRADNLMIEDGHDRVWLIDWPHACVGAPWIDLAFMLPSVMLQGGAGSDPAALFASSEAAQGVGADDLRSALAGLAGYFAWSSAQPSPTGIPNLRAFQAAQAGATLRWLRDLS